MLYTKDEILAAVREELVDVNRKLGIANGFRNEDYEYFGVISESLKRLDKRSQNSGKATVDSSLLLIEALGKYIELLVEELNETLMYAHAHGWKSSRVEEGERQRNRIAELRQQFQLIKK